MINTKCDNYVPIHKMFDIIGETYVSPTFTIDVDKLEQFKIGTYVHETYPTGYAESLVEGPFILGLFDAIGPNLVQFDRNFALYSKCYSTKFIKETHTGMLLYVNMHILNVFDKLNSDDLQIFVEYRLMCGDDILVRHRLESVLKKSF